MSDEEKVREAFIEANINPKLHFTKLGYYKLYGQTKYLWAFVLSSISTILFITCFIMLVRIVNNGDSGLTEQLFKTALGATACGTLSDLLYGDMKAALNWATVTGILAYAVFFFF